MERWRKRMKHFYIITNPQKDKDLVLTGKMQSYILGHGGTCSYELNRHTQSTVEGKEQIPADTECILVVGGDGTLLRVARDMAGRDIPIIGVNTGHVGYLCELDADTAMDGLQKLIQGGDCPVEKRMLLAGHLLGREQDSREHIALNDIVIHRCGALQVVDLIIYVNGEYLNTYSADGIIIATPTGSTAYSMSAGGPIVDPRAKLLLITPISPHTLNAKSIVLGADDEVTIEVGQRRIENDEQAEVSFDGDHIGVLAVGEKIVVKKAKGHAEILKLSKLSFLERLRKKLQGYT